MNTVSLEQAMSLRRTCRDFEDRAVPLGTMQRLLWAAQGVTEESGKRTAPSAHALHPLRLRLVAGNVENLAPGVYSVGEDAARLTSVVARDVRGDIEHAALEDQPWIGRAAGIISICADLASACRHFAEQPPVGARGLRYVYMEAGAAAQNVQLLSTAAGLGCVLVAGFRDEATTAVLDLSPPLAPILHLCLGWPAPA